MALEPGLQAALVHIVSAADTAEVVGSGDLPVLATPRVLALCEAACLAALGDANLAPNSTTVGTRVELEHLVALGVGEAVRVAARLTTVDGNVLRFEVVVTDDGDRVVARANATRRLVDRARIVADLHQPRPARRPP
jgi:predicted thioesterase